MGSSVKSLHKLLEGRYHFHLSVIIGNFEPPCAYARWGLIDHFCVWGFVEPTLCTTAMVQSYIVYHRPVLCTTDLSVHHGAQLLTSSRGHPQYSQGTDTTVVHNAA